VAATLPAHLVPSSVVVLDRLPLTRTGKLDRRALPAPERAAAADRPYTAPETAAEELVARVWTEVLGLDRVGADDDFFALGGHSLLATRVVVRLGATLGLDVPLRALFAAPTVASFAEAVEDVLAADIDAMSDADAERLLAEGR
jgi:acyl carrier protein